MDYLSVVDSGLCTDTLQFKWKVSLDKWTTYTYLLDKLSSFYFCMLWMAATNDYFKD